MTEQVSAATPERLQQLGKAAAAVRLESLSALIIQRAKQRVLDTLGCLVAGYREGISDSIRDYVAAQNGVPQATLLPAGVKTSAGLAGFAHSAYIFGLELADAAPRGTVHPGCEIVSAALAVAEREGKGGAAILPALVAGYEVEIRLGRALHPHAFYRGWSTIGLLGAVGPAVTAAHLLEMDAARMTNAIGIVLNLAPCATGRAHLPGSVKWLVGGQACLTGILAADMAARGVTGMRDVEKGWLDVISSQNLPERLCEGVDSAKGFVQWELLSGVLTKYYAAVGPLTAAIEAMFRLLREHSFGAQDIDELLVDCPRRTAIFSRPRPENDVAARGSLPYCLAVAVYTRDPGQLLGPAYRPESLRNEAILTLSDKVRITENEHYERQYPARSLARVTVRLRDGTRHTAEVDRTEIARYLTPTDADIEDKFQAIAAPILGHAGVERVIERVRCLETMRDVSTLMGALVPPAHGQQN